MKILSKLSLGAVAAGAIAAPSAATTVTVDLNLANGGSGDFNYITLGGNATPQYRYQSVVRLVKNTAYFYAEGTSGFGAQTLSYTSNPDFPALGVATFQPEFIVGNSNAGTGNRYLPLQFDINGTTTVGNAFFNNTNGLVKIEYADVAGGVPEPAIWAELVAGFALAGAAMRRRRPQTALAA
jgi:hypothetical protein